MYDSSTLNNLHSTFYSSLYGWELFKTYMFDLYAAHRKVERRLFRISARTHNLIVIKLTGDLISRLDCRIAKFIFNMVNHDTVSFMTLSKLYSRSTGWRVICRTRQSS